MSGGRSRTLPSSATAAAPRTQSCAIVMRALRSPAVPVGANTSDVRQTCVGSSTSPAAQSVDSMTSSAAWVPASTGAAVIVNAIDPAL
ncbi:MAG: hypothetical protein ACKV2T_21755 [Kofleriaceae bacterium]